MIPNLFQGISQQPDAQRDPSQGEVQINGMSSTVEGLRKREGSTCIAKVSNTAFGDVLFHSILRDSIEQYLAVIAKTVIRVFALDGTEKTVTAAAGAYNYLSSVVSAKADIRAASIADYTFISNTRAVPAMGAALAPAVARPAAHEALVWVKAANYGQRYILNVNGQQATVTTAVAPVIVSGATTTENRISTAEVAARLRGALLGGAPSAITFQGSATTLNGTATGVATTTDEGGSGLTVNVTGNGSAVTAAVINAAGTGYRAGDKVFVQRGLLNGGAVTALNNEGAGSTLNGTLTDVPTTGGSGSGLTVTITGDGSKLTAAVVGSNPGTGYRADGAISVARNRLQGGPVSTLSNQGAATTLNATATGLATTSNTGGTGLTLNVTGNGTAVTAIAVNAAGVRYHIGSKIYIARNVLDGSGTDTTPVHVATVTAVTNADTTAMQIATVKTHVIDDAPVQVATITTAAAGPLTGVSIARSGSVLHLTSSSAITLAATDAKANADITAITGSVQAFTELPTIAPEGYQVEIVGDPNNSFDGYYVKFVPRSGTFGEGSWEETVSPGVQYQVDQATMPHLLVRLPNGTFWFGPANGSTQGGVTIPSWGQRAAGDYDTAPDPSFIGYPIQDVFIYKNRLGFLADENVILSRARDFFEFFPETVTTVLDSDPIDLAASNNRVSVLRYAIPYQDELIIFSDQIQFRFNAAETVLTPSTAQITVLTSYEMDPNCRPIPVQGAIVFCQANGQWSLFREFSVRGAGTALIADASDLSVYVSSYVPSEVFKLAANDTGNVWFALSGKSGYLDRIYVYKYFYRNSGSGAERAQSSWSYWELNGASEILSILCVKEVLYALIRYGTEVWLEKLPVTDRMTNAAPAPYPLLLDRMVSTTAATPAAIRVAAGSYSAVTGLTTWTLPYTVAAPTQAWSGFAATTNGGVLLGEVSSGNTITARGDWSTSPIFFGETFTFRYRFTRFKMVRDIGGGKAAANVLRTQIRHAKLRYHETYFFKVLVTAERRDAASYVFDGTILGVRNSLIGSALNQAETEANRYAEGVFRVPILSRGENAIVEIQNETPHPCKFSTCEWVGLVTGQARGLQ